MGKSRNQINGKSKRSFFSRLIGFFISLFSFALIVIISLSFITKLDSIQEKLAKETVFLLKEQLNANLEIGKIIFDDLRGVELEDVLLKDDFDTIAYIPKLNLRYDLARVISNRIIIDKLIIERPVFKMLRNKKDSLWNVSKIIEPSQEDSVQQKQQKLKIDLRRLEIIDGRAQLTDSLMMRDSLDAQMDYANMQFSEINVDIAALLDLRKNRFRFGLRELKVKETQTDLNLQHTDGELTLTNKSIEADGFEFVLNDSEIDFDAFINNYSVLNEELSNFLDAELEIDLRAKEFHPDLIRIFADPGLDISGALNISLNGSGNFKKFSLNEAEIEHNKTILKAEVELNNFLNPDSLNINYKINNSYAETAEIYSWAPFLKEVEMPDFKKVGINLIRGNYQKDYIEAEVDVNSDIGNIKGSLIADFSEKELYKADVKFSSLNLKKINKSIDYVTSINGNAKIEINGLEPKEMEGYIDLSIFDSEFNNEVIDSLILDVKINSNRFNPLNVSLYTKNSGFAEIISSLDLSGEREKYDVVSNMKSFKPDKIIGMNLPTDITGKINLSGISFDPDDIKLALKVILDEITIDSSKLENINIGMDIDHSIELKEIKLISDFIDLNLKGDYTINRIVEYSNKLTKNLPYIIYKDSLEQGYPDLNLTLSGEFKNVEKLFTLTGIKDFKSRNNFELSLVSDSSQNTLNLIGIELYDTDVYISGTKVYTDSTYISGEIDINEFDLSELVLISNKTEFDDQKLKNIDIYLDYFGNTLNHSLELSYNDEIDLSLSGNTAIMNGIYNIVLDSLITSYQQNIKLLNENKIVVFVDSSKIDITKANFILNNNEKLKIGGIYNLNLDEIGDLSLSFSNMRLNNIIDYLQLEESVIETLEGNLDNITLFLSGEYEDPNINFNIDINGIKLNSVMLGDFSSHLFHYNDRIYGESYLVDPSGKTIMDIGVESFPLKINLKEGIEILEEESSIFLSSEDLPLQAFDPFIPGISRLTGTMDAYIDLGGKVSVGFDYMGSLSLEKVQFLADATNIFYEAESLIEIEKERLNIFNTIIKNKNEDLKNGQANVEGWLAFDENGLGEMNFNMSSDKLLVLRDETKYTMPDLYGDFIISSAESTIRFSGTLDEPNLSGDVDVLKADLKQPNKIVSRMVRSELQYIRRDSLLKIELSPEEIEIRGPEKEFADLINYDLRIRFIGPFYLDSEINAATELFAEIGTENKGDIIRYVKYRDEIEAELTGKILVKNNSVLVSLGKKFRTEGFVEFPTGEITNPGFNLIARYNNQTQEGVPFEVRVLIGGTLENPEISFDYTYNGEEPASNDQQEITQNAFSLIALNMLRNDAFTSAGGGFGGDDLSEYGNTLISSLASQSLSDALGINAEVDLDINNPDAATVRLKGELFENVNWSVGGNISDLNNNEITIEIPLGLLDYGGLDIKLTKPNQVNNNIDQNQIQWEVSIGIKKKF